MVLELLPCKSIKKVWKVWNCFKKYKNQGREFLEIEATVQESMVLRRKAMDVWTEPTSDARVDGQLEMQTVLGARLIQGPVRKNKKKQL